MYIYICSGSAQPAHAHGHGHGIAKLTAMPSARAAANSASCGFSGLSQALSSFDKQHAFLNNVRLRQHLSILDVPANLGNTSNSRGT